MTNKKGLSDVVSNVLIILIVVAAVAILGLIVINLVKSAGGGITSQAACQTLDVQVASCTKIAAVAAVAAVPASLGADNAVGGTGVNADVAAVAAVAAVNEGARASVIRGSGDASLKINKVTLSFVKSDSTTVTASNVNIGTDGFTIGETVSGSADGSIVKVIPIVEGIDGEGNALSCALTQKEATCN